MRLCAQRAPWRRAVEFFLIEERSVDDRKRSQPFLLQPSGDVMAWDRQEEGFAYPRPSFSLTDDAAQELFEMLWSGGFRSKRQIDEASRIEAVNRHLEDMRAIAFDRLKVGKPESRA